ncbi:O-antigen ligase family protein [Pengzhenrongella frigida]|uniref:O-antigen ligase domain-containing protein n=1 Tax=Pengzhenrongella frigida TaxID=1259133 RepID=A0A4Q5N0M9_9MICO|nr:O-antigen ligase family protein [Cellulomonas sp. HLT2-17]RYV50773.1 O-antigen ligase domain-containing protein [Cellulomonas sp. HLT2-17]
MALRALPVLALVIPSALIFAGPLESNGWPPRLLALWIAGAVVLGWVGRRRSTSGPSPAETGSWILLGALACSFAAGGMRTLLEAESAGAVRAALLMFPLVIVALGISTLADARRSNQLLIGLLVGATISAGVAVAQAVTPFDLAQLIQLPGMVAREVGGMGVRGSFVRVKGAAAHPIELGVICGAMLPVAVHFARFARSHRGRVAAGLAALLLVLSIPLSVSRSGVLVAVISMAVYAVVLSNRQRLEALVVTLVGLVLLRAAIPGLLGAVRGIFGGASTDTSITARTDDYAVLAPIIQQSPLLGQGLGTFRPEEYFFLDNQYLLSLVEGGAVLVVAMVVFFLMVVASARGAVLRAKTPAAASRAQAVAGGVLAIAVSGAFFDLFSFAQATVVLFVLAGVAGALWHDGVANGIQIASPIERVVQVPADVAS